MKFCVFLAALLLVRLFYYSSPFRKHIALYGVKAIIESGIFIILFSTPLAIELACVGLLITLNLLTYILEVKISTLYGIISPVLSLSFLGSLLLYVVCFSIVFASGKIAAFERYIVVLTSGSSLLRNIDLYLVIIGGTFILAEEEHVIQFFRRRIQRADDTSLDNKNLIIRQRMLGYAERLVIFLLVILSQYVAAGIIAASKVIVSIGAPKQQRESLLITSVTSICLALICAISINVAIARM